MTNELINKRFIKELKKLCPIIRFQVNKNEISLIVGNLLVENILFFLNLSLFYKFKILTLITSIDYPFLVYRFKLVYELLSITYNNRLKVKTFLHETKPAQSLIALFPNAKWFESEIWDMFGIFFNNHLNLSRLLTDYGFEGFPGRKNFPLIGYVESRYNEQQKNVVRETIEFSQEYRNFKFLSTWNMNYKIQ
jgi:NADH-quinone oxidoreductase subunit C